MKTKKRKKSSRMHGRGMGSHGRGARKKGKGAGHKGGRGLAGTGKRADHKKTLILKKYSNKYFGKKGITSKKTQKDKRKRINLETIHSNLESYGKKLKDTWEINLQKYKILGKGEVKEKLIITANSASKSAIEKVKKAGGKIILKPSEKDKTEDTKKESKKTGKQTTKDNSEKSK